MPYQLIAMFIAGVSAYTYAKDTRPTLTAKLVVIAVVAVTILVDRLIGHWGLTMMGIQLFVTAYVAIHLQIMRA